LSTYLTVKNNFGFEKYLDKIKNFEQRRTLTRFRISTHKLAIETGRYKEIPLDIKLQERKLNMF
jgi:hypothetical protein